MSSNQQPTCTPTTIEMRTSIYTHTHTHTHTAFTHTHTCTYTHTPTHTHTHTHTQTHMHTCTRARAFESALKYTFNRKVTVAACGCPLKWREATVPTEAEMWKKEWLLPLTREAGFSPAQNPQGKITLLKASFMTFNNRLKKTTSTHSLLVFISIISLYQFAFIKSASIMLKFSHMYTWMGSKWHTNELDVKFPVWPLW